MDRLVEVGEQERGQQVHPGDDLSGDPGRVAGAGAGWVGPRSPLTRAGWQSRWGVLAYFKTTLRVAARTTTVWALCTMMPMTALRYRRHG